MAEIYNTMLTSASAVKGETTVNYNVDDATIGACIRRAQTLYLEGALGTALRIRLQTLVYNEIHNLSDKISDSANADYLALLKQYVEPLLIQQTLSEIYMQITYKVRNVGVAKESDTNVASVSIDELRALQSTAETMVAELATRMSAFLESNKALYAEVTDKTSGYIPTPLGKTFANSGLFLGHGRIRR